MEDAFERVAYAIQLKYASIVVATLPIICVYPFVQILCKGCYAGGNKKDREGKIL